MNRIFSKKRIDTNDSNSTLSQLVKEIQLLRRDVKVLQIVKGERYDSEDDDEPEGNLKEQALSKKHANKSKHDTKATSADDCEVMISLHCASMLTTAQRIKVFLEYNGIKVWLCTGMSGGANFRDEIISAVDSCHVFLALINEPWCHSKECKYEFNYSYRKNLTSEPERPVIIPMCFPDLQWNAHPHVRALLANTNALVYKEEAEEDVLEKLKDSLEIVGIEIKNERPTKWTQDDVRDYLVRELVDKPFFESEKLDGNRLIRELDDNDKILSKLSVVIDEMKHNIKTLNEKAVAEEEQMNQVATSHNYTNNAVSFSKINNNNSTVIEDGLYKVIAKTTNYYDQNVTKSNSFLVTLHNGGISSSGCAWNAGTLHNNYDGVTAIWQGEYRVSNGSFHFVSLYSNDTKEEYAGKLEKFGKNDRFLYSRGNLSKYAWFGYGRESYGMMDMYFYKLNDSETQIVKSHMQMIAQEAHGALSFEVIMKDIGPQLSWDKFHATVDKQPIIKVDERGFCSTPSYGDIISLGQPISIQFKLPDSADLADDLIVSIIPKGSTTPDRNRYFTVSEYNLARGYVFSKDKVPTNPGSYEIALFPLFNSTIKIKYTPIEIVASNLWKKS